MAPDQTEGIDNTRTYRAAHEAIKLIWEKLNSYAEDSLGGRIGHGHYNPKHDNEYGQEWSEICEAMDIIEKNINIVE